MRRARTHVALLFFVVGSASVSACDSLIGADFDHGTAEDAASANDADATMATDATSPPNDAASGDATLDATGDDADVDDATAFDAAPDDDAADGASLDAGMLPCDAGVCLVAVTGALAPYGITLAAGVLYITARPSDPNAATGQVLRVSVDGGAVSTIASGLHQPAEILVDGANVFFVSHDSPQRVDGLGSISQMALDGGGRAVAVQGIDDSVLGLALFRGNLVWGASNRGLVYESLPGQGTIHLVTSAYDLGGIRADGDGVYVSSNNYGNDSLPALVSVVDDTDSGLDTRLTVLYSSDDPLYFGNIAIGGNELVSIDVIGGTIDVMDKRAAGTPSIIASDQASPVAVATDGDGLVYWITQGNADAGYVDGTVMRTTIDGGAATPIAVGQNHPAALVLDATHVYWANAGDGTVMSAPR